VDEAVEWLLGSDEPGIRFQTRRDLLDQPGAESPADIMAGPKIAALLEDRRPDGSFGKRVTIRRYAGTSRAPEDMIGVDQIDLTPDVGGTMWRTLSMTELSVPPDPRVQASADFLLDATVSAKPPRVIDGLARIYGFGPGGVLLIASRLGLAGDPRTATIAQRLIEWQWPDGGWNCHIKASGRRSSFHQSLLPARGLREYAIATNDTAAAMAADRAAELFLEHHIYFSTGTGIPSKRRPNPRPAGAIIDQRWTKLGYPSYWHYDVLAALIFLTSNRSVTDSRADPALDLLERKRRPDGLWAADRQWWVPKGHRFEHQVEVVDWGVAGVPSEMITLNALRILRAARRWRP
jgi:hypothetical protein